MAKKRVPEPAVQPEGAPKYNRYDVTPEQFVEVWERSESIAEACEELGMPPKIVSSRAGQYRRKGIPLKEYKKGPQANTIEVDKLRQLVAKIQAERGEEPNENPVFTEDEISRIARKVVEDAMKTKKVK